jgi:signal transduction histidine kinase
MRIALIVMTVGVAAGLALRPVDLSAGGAVVNLVIFVGAGALGAGARQRRERFEAEVVVARERAARSASEERLRITRELHDIIGHAMGVMVVQAGVAERLLDTDPARTRAALASISETGRSSLAEMRQVLGALRDGDGTAGSLPRDPSPTLARLPDLVDQVRGAGLPVTLAVRGGTAQLSPGLELAAYRVIQEALTNSLKHSGASQAWVSVDRAADLLHVVVSDDGRATPSPTTPGQGLAGMRERVAVYGGDLSTGPAAGGGFRVDARFPLGST